MGNISKLVSLLNSFHELLESENRCFDDGAFTCMYVQKTTSLYMLHCVAKDCPTIFMAYVDRQWECFSATGINRQF